jgi:polyisoprenoid-binding protein YceI
MRMPIVCCWLRVFPTHHAGSARLRTRVAAMALSAAVLSSWSATSTAADDDAPVYCLDPIHTRVLLAIDHAGFSKALGTVSGTTGELRFDPEDWSQASVRASVPLNRLDFGDEKWNKAVLAANLLNAARYPDAVFVSERMGEASGHDGNKHAPDERASDGRASNPHAATAYGTLTLHGVSQPVALDIVLNAMKRYPLPPFRRTVGFSARTTLSRKAFGIDAWPSVIGDEVELRIEAEATRGRCDEAANTPKSGHDGGSRDTDRDAPPNAPEPAVPASDGEAENAAAEPVPETP